MTQKKLRLGAFMRPVSIHTAAWRYPGGTPDATTPQANAHIGGNQVMGLKSSVTADRAGSCMRKVVPFPSKSVKEK